jgi:nucleotide-binding universal stress UspA family protein
MPLRAKRILWPTDFSELALHAGKYARSFRDLFQSELHIIHVVVAPVPLEAALTMPAEVPLAVPEPDLLDGARETLNRIIAEHFGGDPAIKYDAFFGTPWSAVCEYARQQAIEFIVICTHGRTGLQRVLIGSTAERIVQHAPCPVLVVKNPTTDFLGE